MESDAEFMARQIRLLARFAEQAAVLAEDLQACALSAETFEQKQSLSFAFHRMGRALRQTVALEAKLRRDQVRGEREQRIEAEKVETARRAARKARVEATVERLIWREAEDEDWAQERFEEAQRFIREDDAHGRIDDDVEAYIAALCRQLGIDPPRIEPDETPSDPPADDDERDYWSSA